MTTHCQAEFESAPALRVLFARVLELRLWVALCVTSLAHYSAQAMHLVHQQAAPGIWAVMFLSTLALYNLDACFDGSNRIAPRQSPPCTNNRSLTRQTESPSRRLQLLLSLGSVAALLPLLPRLSLHLTALFACGFLICSLYAIPLSFGSSAPRRLKAIPGIKAPFVGFAVAIAAVWVPLLSSPLQFDLLPSSRTLINIMLWKHAGALTLILGLLCTVNALLFDVPDIEEDRLRRVPTIARQWGISGNRLLCLSLCVLALAAAFSMLSEPMPVVLLTGVLMLAAVLVDSRTTKGSIALWVDGALILPAALHFLSH